MALQPISTPHSANSDGGLHMAQITAAQIRAARALLGLSQPELAKEAQVSKETIQRVEAKPGAVSAHPTTLTGIMGALDRLGVELIPENGGGPGVRIRKAGRT